MATSRALNKVWPVLAAGARRERFAVRLASYPVILDLQVDAEPRALKAHEGATMDLSQFNSIRIIESWLMVDRVEDWSRVRSPSRARRRMRYGHRHNIRIIEVPKKEAITCDGGITYYMHPATAAELRRATRIPAP